MPTTYDIRYHYSNPHWTKQILRYGEALTTLAQLIVSKSRYHSNGPMLDEIDDTLTDSETKEICHTEWDMFLGKLTQLLSKVQSGT